MSIGPLGGIYASAAGAQLAQSTGSDVDRVHQDATNKQRQVASQQQADSAAGIAETDGKDIESNDRDADGRRPWEFGPPKPPVDPAAEQPPGSSVQSKDSTGECGTSLDLTG
jgi:hypothetical protein